MADPIEEEDETAWKGMITTKYIFKERIIILLPRSLTKYIARTIRIPAESVT